MNLDDLRITVSGLTELDKLELEEMLKGKTETAPEATPSGRLGEPNAWTVVIELGKIAIPTVGGLLGVFLATGRHREYLKDKIKIKTKDGTFERNLSIGSKTNEEAHEALVREISQAAQAFIQEKPKSEPVE